MGRRWRRWLGVTEGVTVGVAEGITVGVAVGDGVGVGVAPAAQKISIDASGVTPCNVVAACQPNPGCAVSVGGEIAPCIAEMGSPVVQVLVPGS